MDSPNRHRILVIDPDPAIRALIVAILKRDGYETEVADGPDEAMRLGLDGRHSAVILEPRIQRGTALLDALQTRARDGKPKVIVVTTPDGPGTAHVSLPGVHTVLLKPFRIDELATVVADCCDGDGARP